MTVKDAYDPGPNGDYPYFPRDSTGAPAWSDTQDADKLPGDNGVARMPRGWRIDGPNRERRDDPFPRPPVDVTPRKPDGTPINPPTLPPAA